MAVMEAASGISRIGQAQGLAVLETAVQPSGPAVLLVLPVVWSRMLGGGAAVSTLLSAFASTTPLVARSVSAEHSHDGHPVSALALKLGSMPIAQQLDHVLSAVLSAVHQVSGNPVVSTDSPVIEMGIDSLGSTEVINRLRL